MNLKRLVQDHLALHNTKQSTLERSQSGDKTQDWCFEVTGMSVYHDRNKQSEDEQPLDRVTSYQPEESIFSDLGSPESPFTIRGRIHAPQASVFENSHVDFDGSLLEHTALTKGKGVVRNATITSSAGSHAKGDVTFKECDLQRVGTLAEGKVSVLESSAFEVGFGAGEINMYGSTAHYVGDSDTKSSTPEDIEVIDSIVYDQVGSSGRQRTSE